MVKIFVVDNGGQWTHREWRTLKYLDVETKIVPNSITFKELKKESIDGIVLSGGAPRIGLTEILGNTDDILKNTDIPVLGICAGHQYMARFFGGKIKPADKPEYGKVELSIIKNGIDIFEGVPNKSIVWLSHNDEVSELPKDFERIAESESCKVQAMYHRNQPFYGLQFHPEVEHTEYGEQIFKNFVNICKK